MTISNSLLISIIIEIAYFIILNVISYRRNKSSKSERFLLSLDFILESILFFTFLIYLGLFNFNNYIWYDLIILQTYTFFISLNFISSYTFFKVHGQFVSMLLCILCLYLFKNHIIAKYIMASIGIILGYVIKFVIGLSYIDPHTVSIGLKYDIKKFVGSNTIDPSVFLSKE